MGSRAENRAEGIGQIIRKDILRLPFAIGTGIKYHSVERIYLPKPVLFGLQVTDKCNSRCTMCLRWKTKPGKEPSLGDIQEIFANPLLNRLEKVILVGGEPTLRDDLAQVTQVILDSNPRIKQVWLITNGLEPSLVRERVKDILELPACSRLKTFGVEVSLDGYGDIHERIRRVPRAFDRVKETLDILKGLQLHSPLSILLNCTVQKLNVSNLPKIAKFAREMGLPINFGPVVQLLDNEDSFKEHLRPSRDQLIELEDFFSHQIKHNIRLPTIAFWHDYFRIIRGEKRRVPCRLPYHSLTMAPEGDLFVCGNESLVYGNVYETTIDKIWYSEKAEKLRKKLRKYICPVCQSSCNTSFSQKYEFFYFAKFLMMIALRRFFGSVGR